MVTLDTNGKEGLDEAVSVFKDRSSRKDGEKENVSDKRFMFFHRWETDLIISYIHSRIRKYRGAKPLTFHLKGPWQLLGGLDRDPNGGRGIVKRVKSTL